MKDSIYKILMLFNANDKKVLFGLFLMMIVAAIFETIGIGMIVPIVGLLTNPEIIQEQAALKYLYNLLDFQSTRSFIVFSVIGLLLIFVFKNLYLLIYNYIQIKVILNHQVKLSRKLFKEYLTKPYTFHLQRNTANLLRNVNNEVSRVFGGIIISGFQLLTELLVTIFVLILLLFTEPVATLTATILLVGGVLLFLKRSIKK